MKDALDALGMVAEGVYAAIAAHELALAKAVQAPLLDRVYRVLYEGLTPETALDELMTLDA
jgi:glycerol-3-phosphate dehydrogenase (NAD(P)+)